MEAREWQLDVLKEAGTVGIGNAAKALSSMLCDRMVYVSVPSVRFVPLSEAAWIWGDPEAIILAAYVPFTGGLSGSAVFGLPEDAVRTFMRFMSLAAEVECEMYSIFTEMANIVVTSYLNALSSMTGWVLRPSVPRVAETMAGAVIESVLALMEHTNDSATVIDTTFSLEGGHRLLGGRLILVPDKMSLCGFLQAVEATYCR
ncbi:MAG TPA: hypothetical protein GXX40_08445 [Firmicutes bacterium]|nr:hypothetical protein [Bacillota bacterium]